MSEGFRLSRKAIPIRDFRDIILKEDLDAVLRLLKEAELTGYDDELGNVGLIVTGADPKSHMIDLTFSLRCYHAHKRNLTLQTPYWKHPFALSGMADTMQLFIEALSAYMRHIPITYPDHKDDSKMKRDVEEIMRSEKVDQTKADEIVGSNYKSNILTYDSSILVVDDKKELRDESGNMFRTLGYKDITTAINGADALEKLKGRTIGLVLSDFDMDQMGGIDLLKSVRRGNAGASLEDTLFFIYTYNILKKKVVEANRLGVDAYIIKPLQEEVLENKLRPYTITN